MYVTTILDVHKKYNKLVLTAFKNDSGFVAALDKACGKFINNNAVTKYVTSSQPVGLFSIKNILRLNLCLFYHF